VMTLFSDPESLYSHRIRLVLSEKGVVCDIVDVDPENLPEDVMDLNPYGGAPMLVDRDLALYDTRAIYEYIDERFPHPSLLPADPISRANTRQLLFRVEREWYPLVDQILAGGRNAPKVRKKLKEQLIATASVFAARPFFMSKEYSVVDASLATLLWRLELLGIDLAGNAGKQVNTYAARMFTRPGFARSLTEAEREMRGRNRSHRK